MSHVADCTFLLGQMTRWKSLGRGVRGKSDSFDLADLLLVTAVFAGIILLF